MLVFFFGLEAALRRNDQQELDNWISVKIIKEAEYLSCRVLKAVVHLIVS